jgi:luciferase family oxidoreductase group 1
MSRMTKLSVLDLAPVVEGSTTRQALNNSLDLAWHAERLGYHRFWLAEHHNMVGIASAATAVVIAHVAGGTKTIRVGAGGIMLPNHAPLMVAEAFGTLAELHPGRIDLGLGRAPGTDQATMRALRRNLGGADTFPQDVVELMGWFEPPVPGQTIIAVPGNGADVEMWILGSSLFGAQLAAHLGLPYAFASHFAPGDMMGAIQIYRERFRPSPRLQEPYVMLGLNVIGAETDEDANLQFTSIQQAFANLRLGRPGKMPKPMPGLQLDPMVEHGIAQALSCSVIGSPAKVKAGIAEFIARTGADELMITGTIWEHAKRVRSFEIAAAAIT